MNPWILTGLAFEAVIDVIEDGQTFEEVLLSDKWWGSVSVKRDRLLGVFDVNTYREDSDEDVDKVMEKLLANLEGWGTWEALSDMAVARNTVCRDSAWACVGFEDEYRREVAALIMIANFGKRVDDEDEVVSHIFGSKEAAKASPHAYKILKALRMRGVDDVVNYAKANGIKGNDAFLLGCMLYGDEWDALHEKAKLPAMLEKYRGHCEYVPNDPIDVFDDRRLKQLYREYLPGKEMPVRPKEIVFNENACADVLAMNHPKLGDIKGYLSIDNPCVAWYRNRELSGKQYELRLLGNRLGPSDEEIARHEWLLKNFDVNYLFKEVKEIWRMLYQVSLDDKQLVIEYDGKRDKFVIIEDGVPDKIYETIRYSDDSFDSSITNTDI